MIIYELLKSSFGFHSYPMPSALQLTFSNLPVGYSCSSSFPTLDGSVFPRSSWLPSSPRKVCWHKIQLMNPFPDCLSRFKTQKDFVEHLFFLCYNLFVATPFLSWLLVATFSWVNDTKFWPGLSLTETWPKVDKIDWKWKIAEPHYLLQRDWSVIGK